ncbi:Phosphoglucomutase-like protein [Dirofilaria immitis]
MISFDCCWRFTFELIIFAFIVRYNDSLKGYEADSWGTEFIFILPSNSHNVIESSCYIFGMNKLMNITVNIDYNIMITKNNNSEVVQKKDKVIIRASYKYEFNKLVINDMIEGLHMLGDNRIHVTSSDKISIIAYTIDNKFATDYFLVHPVGMGGDYYAFSLPGPSIITLYFLPLGATNETISQNDGIHHVSMRLRENDKLEIINQTMQAGSLWQYTAFVEHSMSVWIRDQLNDPILTTETQTALNIKKARLIIIASARDIIASGRSTDFGCHMPTPTIVDRCGELTNPVYYPAGQGFATNLLLTAPTQLCPQEVIDFRTNIETSNRVSMNWNKAAKEISVKDKILKQKTFAVVSEKAIMNIVHHGGTKGSFIHEIPAYSQWVNGDSSIIVPVNSTATIYVLADDYGKDVVMEGFDYPLFEPMDDVSPDFSLFLYTHKLKPGVYRVGIDQELGGRYIAVVIAELGQHSIGYVAAINLNRIPSPIFVDHSTTVSSTTTEPTTTSLVVSTMTTVTTTQSASIHLFSHILFVICICFIIYGKDKQ